MFIDEATIQVHAGDGGNGCFSYCRLKFQPRGKPDGGKGGRGGHIYITGSAQVSTLLDVSYRRSYKGGRGQHGKGSNKDGKMGEDVIITVPLGTVILDDESKEVLYDCTEPDKKFLIARGGLGGRGNAALKSSRNPNPDHAEFGKQGEEKKIRFMLKVIADIGLVGRPNAGKSTLLSVISHAHPKIADYPFTTTEPHLGIVKMKEGYDSSFVVADIPGLIEGSHLGKGLGIKFLKHIERTKALAIMVESTAKNPKSDAAALIEELRQYSPALAEKPKCFILTKTDLIPGGTAKKIRGWLHISSVTNQGIGECIGAFKRLISQPAG